MYGLGIGSGGSAAAGGTITGGPFTTGNVVIGGGGQAVADSGTAIASFVSTSANNTFTANGAASTPTMTLSGSCFVGTGTTSTPCFYINQGTAPTTWSTGVGGTLIGLNAVASFAGNFMDFHLNGGGTLFKVDSFGSMNVGTITGLGTINAAAASGLGFVGRSRWTSAADGRLNATNAAGASLGLTRFTLGTEAATNPAFAPLNTILDVIDGAGTATFGNTTVLNANGNKVFVTTNFTTAANTNLQAITGLTFNFPAVAKTWNFSCHLAFSQATGTAAVAFGIQAATNAPTNIFATGEMFTAAGTVTTGVLATLTTTTATTIVSGTPGATGTNLPVDLYGTLELGASANAVSIQVSTATSGDAVTVLRGSSCQLT